METVKINCGVWSVYKIDINIMLPQILAITIVTRHLFNESQSDCAASYRGAEDK